MSYPGRYYPSQVYPSQTGGALLGTDTSVLSESAQVVVTLARSDPSALTDQRSTNVTLTRSDGASGADTSSPNASATATDSAVFTETQDMFQGLLKEATDSATISDQASLFATYARTDTATQSDNKTGSQPYATRTRPDSAALSETKVHGPLVEDVLTAIDIVMPGQAWITKSDAFNWQERFDGYFEFSSTDSFTFFDEGNYYEKLVINEDPIVYPEYYYGTTRTRVIAQDHFTREFVHWDLPIDNLQLTFSLSGPNLLSGTLSTEMPSLMNLNPPLLPDRTLLHVEDNGYIIASFIMTPFIDNPQDQTRTIEGEGLSAYPHWVYYEGEQFVGVQVDPADMIRKIWNHVQSFPDGNLYVKVWATVTPVRIGYPNNSVTFRSKEGNEVSITGEPYNLNFWSVINCGEEINRLAQETPIEYWEYSAWNEQKSDVDHYIVLGYPRVGGKRIELTFREGENLTQLVPSYQEAQENYASDVLVIGAGEGPGAVRVKHAERIGRLRRTHVIHDQQISNKQRAQAIADFEFNRLSQSRYLIENITIDTTHTNARWGTFIAGDDIFVQCTIPYVGYVQDWYRIVSYTYDPYSRTAILNLSPSNSFTYGATNYNPYVDIPKEGFAVLSDADFDLSDNSDLEQQEQINIKLAQQAGVEAFNKNNIKSGFAYAYMKVGNTTSYVMKLVPISEVIEPYFVIIARTQDGYLITGENVYLVASDGSIGQPPESTNTNPDQEFTGTTGSVTLSPPFPTGLQLAAREYHNAFTSNMYISPELTYMGMSANASAWRQTIGYQFYTLAAGQYNYALKSPGGAFAFLVSNVSRNVGYIP